MSDKKMLDDIERVIDSSNALQRLTHWEQDFIRSVREILSNPYKTPSVKQKTMCFKILAKARHAP